MVPRLLLVATLVAAVVAAPVLTAGADDFDVPLPPTDAAPLPPDAEPLPVAVAPDDLPPAPDDLPPAPGNADEAFDLKAKALEERVNDLKEKVFRTKGRLLSLAEAIIDRGGLSGAKLALWHRNELGSSYRLVSAAYTLDGAPLYTKVDPSGDLDDREEFVIFDQRIAPGQHVMTVRYVLRGHGYGVFAYLEGLEVTLTRRFQFNVEAGKVTKVTAAVYEQDGITLQFKDKPEIRFDTVVQKDFANPDAEPLPAPFPQANGDGAGR